MIHSFRPLLALLLAFAFLPLRPALADSPVIHTVQPGENLYRIGVHYGVNWPDIAQANALPNTIIYAGQQLIIPVPGATPLPPTPAPSEAAPTLSATHTVSPGETLLMIAVRYGVAWQAIAETNGIPNPNLIFAGQQLAIPGAALTPSLSPETGPSDSVEAPGVGAGASKKIVVDISEQHLYAYEGDRLVFSFVASTGLPGLDTQPGNYNVQSKIPNAYGGNWNIWMPHWLGIYWAGYLENGIHSLPILPGGSRLWEGYLGQPISYGCVVLGIAEAEHLWNWAAIGDSVLIQQ